MKYILTAEQMKASDAATIQRIGIPSLVLMERAALQCVRAMEEEGIDTSRTLVVCGSGNNGGDGFAIARLLVEAGNEVDTIFVGNMDSRSEETCRQMQILEKLGIPVGNSLPEREYSVIIDAIFGIGLCREITGRYSEVIRKLNAYTGAKVAVDIASGISADSGKVLGCAFRADLTVTFAYAKTGHLLYPGAAYSGRVLVRRIGIHNPELEQSEEVYYTLERADAAMMLPERKADSNKGSFGKVLCITGSRGMSGAAYLSAKAAYLAGAGLVRIYTEESNRQILQQLLPEAVMSTYVDRTEDPMDGDSEPDCFAELPSLLAWADVVCIGCGLGRSAASEALVRIVLRHNQKPCVMDADALNILADFTPEEEALWKPEEGSYILTPHMKEMSRLTGYTIEDLKENRTILAKEYARRKQITCVLKDSRTIVAQTGKPVYLNTTGNSALAKGGSGDVLAGLTAGLLAQKLPSYEAAVLGTYLHGLAGEEAGNSCGLRSALAEDILTGIRKTLKNLEEM